MRWAYSTLWCRLSSLLVLAVSLARCVSVTRRTRLASETAKRGSLHRRHSDGDVFIFGHAEHFVDGRLAFADEAPAVAAEAVHALMHGNLTDVARAGALKD